MSEAAKPMAVEDVLTSIRRLLAQGGNGAGAPADPGEISIEHTLAALEAAMVGRRAAEPAVAAPSGADPSPAPAGQVMPEPPAGDISDVTALTGTEASSGEAPSEGSLVAEVGAEADPPVGAAPEVASPPDPRAGLAQDAGSDARPVADPEPEAEEAPFIAVDMAEPAPSFSFRHSAEVRRLQLVSPREPEEPSAGVEEATPAPPATAVSAPAEPPVDPEPPVFADAALSAAPLALPVTGPSDPSPIAEAAGADPTTQERIAPAPESLTIPVAPRTVEPEPLTVAPEPLGAAPDAPAVAPGARTGGPAALPPRRRPVADPGFGEDAPQSIFDENDELPLDLDLLRRMVANILRQELQGALGERVTRNVRKLVRAEIHRALLERDEG